MTICVTKKIIVLVFVILKGLVLQKIETVG